MAEDARVFDLHFEDLTPADAGFQAARLREALLDASPDVDVDLRKDDPTTQDFGATLILALGTPAVIAVAKGIQAFLSRERQGTLVIRQNGEVVFKGNSADAAKISAALSRRG